MKCQNDSNTPHHANAKNKNKKIKPVPMTPSSKLAQVFLQVCGFLFSIPVTKTHPENPLKPIR
jgi:hypothetical protein